MKTSTPYPTPKNRAEALQQALSLRGLIRQDLASDSQILRYAMLEDALAGRAVAASESAEWERIGARFRNR